MSDLITTTRARLAPQLAGVETELLSSMIASASTTIERYCQREFALQERTEIYDGDSCRELLLDTFPVTKLTAVTIIENGGTEIAVDPGEFRMNAENGLLCFKPESTAFYTYFPNGFQNIVIKYEAGFASIPADIQEACVFLVCALYAGETKDASVKSERLGDYSVSLSTIFDVPLPSVVKELLASYRDFRA